MLTGSTCFILLFLIAFPFTGICQTGFYLTSPCSKGDSNLKRFEPDRKNLCLVASPIVALEDIASISDFAIEKGRQMFEMKLTSKGLTMLRTAFSLSPVVAFVVDKEIFFVMDTAETELFQTLKIFQSDHTNFSRLHNELQRELQLASRK